MASKNKKKTKAQRELDESWEKLMLKHSKPLELGLKSKPIKITGPFTSDSANKTYQKLLARIRSKSKRVVQSDKPQLTRIPSLVTPGADTGLKPPQQYTGSAMLGIATMHKSSMVPVFSSQEAVEYASMRR